jgi:hypothetical protein
MLVLSNNRLSPNAIYLICELRTSASQNLKLPLSCLLKMAQDSLSVTSKVAIVTGSGKENGI